MTTGVSSPRVASRTSTFIRSVTLTTQSDAAARIACRRARIRCALFQPACSELAEIRMRPNPTRSTCASTWYTSDATVSSVMRVTRSPRAVHWLASVAATRSAPPPCSAWITSVKFCDTFCSPPSLKSSLVIRISLIRTATNSPGGISKMRVWLAIRVFFHVLWNAAAAARCRKPWIAGEMALRPLSQSLRSARRWRRRSWKSLCGAATRFRCWPRCSARHG